MSERFGRTRASRSVTGAVVNGVRDLIMANQLPPGSRLLQDPLREQFGASATSVREAMRELENEGLVHRIPNRGVFVTDIGEDELTRVLHPVRITLEGFAIEKIVERRDELDLSPLEKILEGMERAALGGDLRGVHEADVQFHEWLIWTADQPHTRQLWHSILPRVRAQFVRLGGYHSSVSDIVEEHAALLHAIKLWELPQIQELLEEHIAGAARKLLERQHASEDPQIAG